MRDIWVIFENTQCPAVSFRIVDADVCNDSTAIMFTGDPQIDIDKLFQKLKWFTNMNMRPNSSRSHGSDFMDHEQSVMVYSKIYDAASLRQERKSGLGLFKHIDTIYKLEQEIKDINEQASAEKTILEQEIISLHKVVKYTNEYVVVVLRKELEESSAEKTILEQEIISLHKVVKYSNEYAAVLRKELEESSAEKTALEQEIISLHNEVKDINDVVVVIRKDLADANNKTCMSFLSSWGR